MRYEFSLNLLVGHSFVMLWICIKYLFICYILW